VEAQVTLINPYTPKVLYNTKETSIILLLIKGDSAALFFGTVYYAVQGGSNV